MARKRKLPPGLEQRGGTYYSNFSSGGRRIRKRLSTDFTVAKQLLNDLRSRSDRGDFGILDIDYPWGDLKAAFLRWAEQGVRNPQDYKRDLDRFEDFAPVRNVQEVTADRVDRYRSHRLDQGKSPRTVNREVGTLMNMLNKGVGRFKVIDHNPIAGVEPLAHDELAKERRPLDLEEVEALFTHSPEHLKGVWRVFMTTGIRKAELVDLRFSDIDFTGRTMTVKASTAKSHKAREIPLDDIALALLSELQDRAEQRQPVPGGTRQQTAQQLASFTREHAFVSRANTPLKNNLLRTFYSICGKAGIEGAEAHGSVDIHSLRVTFTTLSLEHGANPKAIQAILGHSTLAMTMGVYAKATGRAKRDAIGRLPFAQVSEPAHVLKLDPKKVQPATGLPQVREEEPKPLKLQAETA